MAHYAFLDDNSIVTHVIVGNDEEDGSDWEQFYADFFNQSCVRTSYNTFGGAHAGGGQPFRKNFAGPGYFYDADRDAFIPPKPFPSSVLNEDTCLWEYPIPKPDDDLLYEWDEATVSWQLVEFDLPDAEEDSVIS